MTDSFAWNLPRLGAKPLPLPQALVPYAENGDTGNTVRLCSGDMHYPIGAQKSLLCTPSTCLSPRSRVWPVTESLNIYL